MANSIQPDLFEADRMLPPVVTPLEPSDLASELRKFEGFGKPTICFNTPVPMGQEALQVPTFVNEFWTAKQRAAHSLHEISYRACFKPQLPRFFVERLTRPGEVVYDPFMGRGTTLLEAALLDRIPYGNDANPLSRSLLAPRLNPPSLEQIAKRLQTIPWDSPAESSDLLAEDLLVFYHPNTLRQLLILKRYLLEREKSGQADLVDQWIRMVALNRLTGHSAGFFSVYTLPPNQAVSIKSQRKINADRNQTPAAKELMPLILRKSRQLLADGDQAQWKRLREISQKALLSTALAEDTPEIPSQSVSLAVTSPPFLNVVDYATDNWLRCWFLGLDSSLMPFTVPKKLVDWEAAMEKVMGELHRVLKQGGHLAFEVGEVVAGKINLELAVVRAGKKAGLHPLLILINDQEFTKTANCWGVQNNQKGTNSNRIVVFGK